MVDFKQVSAAADRIAARACRTPVKQSQALNAELGCHVYLKCENEQKSGAFKFRGACNALLQLSPEQRAQGVVTVSSGNHGAALAAAGQMLGVQVKVGVAKNASPVKRTNMLRYGANIIAIEPGMAAREAFIAEQLAQDAIVIPPYDHPDIIAGQGSAACEGGQEIRRQQEGGRRVIQEEEIGRRRQIRRCREAGWRRGGGG